MRSRTLCLLGFFFGACAVDPTETVGQVEQPILGGTRDNSMDPSVVILIGEISGSGGAFVYCTASVITPKVLLTAAHCVNDSEVTRYHVEFFDSWNLQTDTRTGVVGAGIGVTDRWHDPLYDDNGGNLDRGHDIGLVALASPVPESLVPLPYFRGRLTNGNTLGRIDRFVGYGERHEADDNSLVARQYASTAITQLGNQRISLAQSSVATCFGDSGGPHTIEIDGVATIVAVSSYVFNDCAGTTIDQRIDIYADEIADFIASHDPQGTAHCGADGVCGISCPDIDPDCPCVADGKCDVACPKLDEDPDCPAACDDDGVCQRTGCPRPDPDCGDGAFGETCTTGGDCTSNVCIGAICTQSCDAANACPSGFTCASNHFCQGGAAESGGGGCAVGGGDPSGLAVLGLLGAFAWMRRRRASPRR